MTRKTSKQCHRRGGGGFELYFTPCGLWNEIGMYKAQESRL